MKLARVVLTRLLGMFLIFVMELVLQFRLIQIVKLFKNVFKTKVRLSHFNSSPQPVDFLVNCVTVNNFKCIFVYGSTTVKYILAAFFGAVIFCEWFIYLVQQQYWTDLECSKHDSTCTKILFIADPQIQGDLAVPPPLSYLFNWDSDRYG